MKLSIITINRNNAAGLQKTMQSVAEQTFADFEYLVIDGASSDGSVAVIKTFVDSVNYWISEPDSGIYNAMNKGIARAKGEYLLFLNSGDYLAAGDTLEKVFDVHCTEDIVYGNRINIDADGNTQQITFPEVLTFSFLRVSALPHQAMFMKKQIFDIVGPYNEHNKYASDWEHYLLAFVKHQTTYRYLNLNIVYFDVSGISSQTGNRKEMFAERESILQQEFPLFYDDYLRMEELQKQLWKVDRKAMKLGIYLLNPLRKLKRVLVKK